MHTIQQNYLTAQAAYYTAIHEADKAVEHLLEAELNGEITEAECNAQMEVINVQTPAYQLSIELFELFKQAEQQLLLWGKEQVVRFAAACGKSQEELVEMFDKALAYKLPRAKLINLVLKLRA